MIEVGAAAAAAAVEEVGSAIAEVTEVGIRTAQARCAEL